MSTALVIPDTVTGVLLSLVFPLPKLPQLLRPQHLTVPSAMTAHECHRLGATFVAFVMPFTETGYERCVLVPSPNCPKSLKPQHATPPCVVTAHECRSPDWIPVTVSPSIVSVAETRFSANSPVSACTAVMTAVPADATVISPVEAFQRATAAFDDSYDQAPGLSEVGAVGAKSGDANVLAGIEKEPTVARRSTRISVWVEVLPHVPDAACVAVKVVAPRPITVTRPVVSSMVATEVLELEYVIAPGLLEVGNVGVNAASPSAFVMPIPA